MEILGTITEIFDEQQITEKFSKREFVVKTEGEYPQEIIMQFTNQKCLHLNQFKIGQRVNAYINLKGRAYEKNGEKFYRNTVECWQLASVVGKY